jgi:hypothetical protein
VAAKRIRFHERGTAAHKGIQDHLTWLCEHLDCSPNEQGRKSCRIAVEGMRKAVNDLTALNSFDKGTSEFTVKVSLVSRYFPILSARLTTTVSE